MTIRRWLVSIVTAACVTTIGVAAQQGRFRSGIELVSLNLRFRKRMAAVLGTTGI